MSNDRNNQDLLMGAAIAVGMGILGTLSTVFRFKRKHKEWPERAKEIAMQILKKRELFSKKLFLGSIAGSVIGVTTALLLAPKAGKDLIKDLTHPFSRSFSTHQLRRSPRSNVKRKAKAHVHKSAAYSHRQKNSGKKTVKKNVKRSTKESPFHKIVEAAEKVTSH